MINTELSKANIYKEKMIVSGLSLLLNQTLEEIKNQKLPLSEKMLSLKELIIVFSGQINTQK